MTQHDTPSPTRNNGPVDPITVEIIQSSLRAITDEMFATMRKTAMSSIIYEVLDFGVAMFDADGQLASSGSGIPGFIGMLEPGVKSVRAKYHRPGDVGPGDIFMTNIPHHGGVSHMNDVVLILPVFAGDTLIGWLANKAHWVDLGGAFPGGISADARDLYQEGLQLPCIKVIEAGRVNQAVLDIIQANSRQPDISKGDFWAGVASMRAGERRFKALAEKYGTPAVLHAIADYIETGERMARAALKALPHGRFEATERTDDSIELRTTITITDDAFEVDLRGNPPTRADALNCTLDATMVNAQMIFMAICGPDNLANSGTFRPIRLLVDDDSMFAARYPAAVSVYYETTVTGFDLLWKALAPALPERLTAGHYASICGTFLGGPHPETGQALGIVEPQLGGWGAAATRDGVNALYTGYHGDTFNVPAEVAEQRNGLMVDRLSLSEAPGGEGRHMGGRGIRLHYRIMADGWWITTAYVRTKNGPWGLDGGRPGSTNYIEVVRASGERTRHAACTALPLDAGDVVEVVTAHGGGYGDPAERPARQVAEDVKNGYVSPARAAEVYGYEGDPA
ncbi:methylhydantoinase [Rhodothalassium salexigens]|uniref:hydantoinase B/oxoprolinase family protein n=1 Tax=Rhodothalassium salexigens TaxID=1086 RepID=UPI0019129C0B|nr:hydantoinase B/oxoprolinase family protein [Rhodothalassium salexigens]MBK5912569.1 methylhydantoinase [Rhodothalassium salexigens]